MSGLNKFGGQSLCSHENDKVKFVNDRFNGEHKIVNGVILKTC